MIKIPITNTDKFTTIDEATLETFEKLQIEKKAFFDGKGGVLVYVNKWHKSEYLSRIALRYFGELFVDHIDLDKTNNQIANLRIATPAENAANSKKRKHNRAKYKGVRARVTKRYFEACITVKGRYISLDSYQTQEEAALAYNKAATKYFGEFAYLNVIPQL